MPTPLHILIVEDDERDAQLILRTIERHDVQFSWQRVESPAAMQEALRAHPWDLVISDYNIPGFGGPEALQTLQESGLDIPFILISGTVGEEIAVEMIRQGAQDYLMKDKLTRLPSVIRREVTDAEQRRLRRETEKALRLSEEQIRMSEAKFRSFVENASDIIFTLDYTGVFTYLSPNILTNLGYHPENSLGRAFTTVIEEEDAALCAKALQNLFSGKTSQEKVAYRIRNNRNNHWQWHLTTLSVLDEGNRKPTTVLGIAKDISEMKLAELALQKSEAKAREQSQKLTSFTHILSHYIRSHSSSIMGLADLLSITSDPAEKDAYIPLLQRIVQKLDQTILDLNEVITTGESDTEVWDAVLVRPMLEEIATNQQRMFPDVTAQVQVLVPGGLWLKTIPRYFTSIFAQLISNAIRFRSPKRPLCLHIDAAESPAGVVISVRDNGEGIDMARYGSSLFKIYTTFHPNSDTRGFGLFLAKTLADVMGCSIEAESAPDEGTVFRVFFPAGQPSPF